MRGKLILIVGIALTSLLALSACASEDGGGAGIVLTGSVADDTVVLSMPRLSLEPTSPAQPPEWSRVASVPLELGTRVRRGDVVAVLDSAVLRSGVSLAEAQLAEARAQEDVLGERAEDVASKQADVASTRSDLRRTLADLRDKRDQVAAQLAQARRLAEQMPPGGLPPGGLPPGALPPGAPPGALPPGAPPGGQDPRAIVAQLEAALAQIDDGIARAEDGLAKLGDASAQLADASRAIDAASAAVGAMVDARASGVALAKALLERATLRAPSDGVLTSVPVLGDVLAAGAPLAEIRPDASSAEVVTYLTAGQVRLIDVGDRARIGIDSLPGRSFEATVGRIGLEHVYVPSRFATRQIHLLRGVEVRLKLTDATRLPPGTPADVTVFPK